jgi:antitoxin HicB
METKIEMETTAMRYPVTLSQDTNGSILVRFSDVPEAITFGDTREAALRHAVDALLSVFDAYMRDRRDIPAPSTRGRTFVRIPTLDASKIALYQAMRERGVTKSELGRRLHWHMPQVDRVLQVRHGSQLEQLEAAFAAVGKHITFTVDDIPGAIITKAKSASSSGRVRRLAAKKR